jgi:putative flippase GtrA
MRPSSPRRREGLLIGGHISVSMVGFALDAIVLATSLGSGLDAAVARLISLFWAMQATFVLNGLFVFGKLTLKSLPGQWARYMASNGIGNVANYLIFVGLVTSRWPLISNHYAALCVAAFTAWTINYSGARLWVFGRRRPLTDRSAADGRQQVSILARLRSQILRRRLDGGAKVGGGVPGPARIVEEPAGERHEIGVAGP